MKCNGRTKLVSAVVISILLTSTSPIFAQDPAASVVFPVVAELFVDEPFRACEGIAFNGEGRMFATCNLGFWEIRPDGSSHKLAELQSNLGVAGIGKRDLLVADFGASAAFGKGGRNTDGVILRITPEGAMARLDTGIGDPNFILVRPDGSFLVSDDATADIYLVQQDGTTELYSTAVNHPNGMVLSQDGATLYVAQTFTNIRPVVFDSSVWKIRLNDEGRPARDARLAVRAGPNAGVDGLAMDANGRIYIAANRAGEIWRYDPATEEMLLITRDIIGVASLAFGEGAFDARSIYATTTRSGGLGGQIWRIPVDAEGARLYR